MAMSDSQQPATSNQQPERQLNAALVSCWNLLLICHCHTKLYFHWHKLTEQVFVIEDASRFPCPTSKAGSMLSPTNFNGHQGMPLCDSLYMFAHLYRRRHSASGWTCYYFTLGHGELYRRSTLEDGAELEMEDMVTAVQLILLVDHLTTPGIHICRDREDCEHARHCQQIGILAR